MYIRHKIDCIGLCKVFLWYAGMRELERKENWKKSGIRLKIEPRIFWYLVRHSELPDSLIAVE